jgi:hypothetical protein
MKLVLGQECEPIHAILLVLPKLCIDLDRNMVRVDLAAVEKLCQELTLFMSSLQKLFREARRIWQTSLHKINQGLRS